MAFEETDSLPISALQHVTFCERRCALVLIERMWDDNIFTATGTVFHSRPDEPVAEMRGDSRISRGLMLRSSHLGLHGKADVVEFHRLPQDTVSDASAEYPTGIKLPGAGGLWRPFPVEYKVGRLRHEEGYEVQLCAQALCLEEMLRVHIPGGALFYGKPRRRLEVTFDRGLRDKTETLAKRLHDLVASGKTPPAEYGKKCRKCSLLSLCMPKTAAKGKSAKRYLAAALRSALEDTG